MIELNLLKYINKSFSEIYQIKRGELTEESPTMDETVTTETKKSVAVEKPKTSILKKLIIIGISLLITSAALLIFIFYKIKKAEDKLLSINTNKQNKIHLNTKNNPKDNNAHQATQQEHSKQEENTITREGFTKIGSIEFQEDKETPVDNAQPKENIVSKISNLFKNSNNENKYKNLPDNASYSVRIVQVPDFFLDTVKNKVTKNNLKYSIEFNSQSQAVMWSLYKLSPGSKKIIAGKEMELVKDFNTKEEAIKYMESNGIKGSVVTNTASKKHFNLIVNTFINKTDAENFCGSLTLPASVKCTLELIENKQANTKK